VPETRYARSGSVHIAYQVVGTGPIDLVVVPGWVSHIEDVWEHADSARFFERLASFSRLILFDKRGTGLSDRVAESQLPTLEQRMDDVRGEARPDRMAEIAAELVRLNVDVIVTSTDAGIAAVKGSGSSASRKGIGLRLSTNNECLPRPAA
jgi:pimeloyl-ACP methyl ester carboxylesterase